jgi:hypothetical protein
MRDGGAFCYRAATKEQVDRDVICTFKQRRSSRWPGRNPTTSSGYSLSSEILQESLAGVAATNQLGSSAIFQSWHVDP